MAQARRRVSPLFVELFEGELRATAARVATDRHALIDGVELYHGLLEAVIFLAGQDELLARLDARGDLPGIAEGIKRVQRDERWHVAFGARMLADARGVVSADRRHADPQRVLLGEHGGRAPDGARGGELARCRCRLRPGGGELVS